ncbi:hypothetical protein N7470_008311 [Penicillium chermesinum]|nr:hypothetical protein N7470_008311 [Penicillium chermesinum]
MSISRISFLSPTCIRKAFIPVLTNIAGRRRPRPRWTHLSRRRLQTWPSSLTKSNTLLDSSLPSWLITPIIEPRFHALGIFTDSPHKSPNHVLVNEYRPGQGIMPHEDGAAYYPIVATVSLGAPIVLDIYPKNDPAERRNPQFRILQERRSLLVTKERLYSDFLHGIAEVTRDEDLGAQSICNWGLLGDPGPFEVGSYARETRTSLTFRDVLKVAKMGKTLNFLGGPK